MDCTKNMGSMTVSIPAAGDPLILSATPVSAITFRIVAAERLAVNTVRLINEISDIVLKNPKAPSLRVGDAGEVVWERIERGFKLQQSRLNDVVIVQDGRFVPAGTPTPLLTKCPTG